MAEEKDNNDQKLNLWQIASSTMAAFFGVQNQANKERDFQHGSHKVFIIAGIIFTLLFMLTLFVIVNIIVS